MANVRERFSVPRLRKLVKSILKGCWVWKRFRAIPDQSPPPELLLREGTEGNTPFNVIGEDFAGPEKYLRSQRESKRPT